MNPKSPKDLQQFWQSYRDGRRSLLSALGLELSNRDPLAEFSEHLVAALVGGTLAASKVQKGYDLVDPGGRKVQVRYLANPGAHWVNEHYVSLPPDVEDYALVFVHDLQPDAVIMFPAGCLGQLGLRLAKKHPNQDIGIQLTRANYRAIVEDPARFSGLGVRVWLRDGANWAELSPPSTLDAEAGHGWTPHGEESAS